MKIAIDAMGGDNAPNEIIKGAIDAVNEYEANIILVGDETIINQELKKYNYNEEKIELIHTTQVIENEDKPSMAIRKKKDSSMVVATTLVAEKKADAIVSAGNTGALLASGLFILKRIKGIDRPALCTFIPTKKGISILLDAGANAECKSKNLEQFGIMGYIYAKKILKINNPKVGIVNVGSEEGKGNELTKASYELLKEQDINFIGNIEARYINEGDVNVIVADGFTGNVVLKLMEGVAMTIFDMLKDVYKKNLKTKMSALLIKEDLKNLKANLDYAEYGGAPLVGVNGNLIKAHGSSDSKAIKNAIKQAMECSKENIIEDIKSYL